MSLPDLTDRQLAFVFGLLQGKNGAQAYRDAYDASNMSDNSVRVEACRLRHSAKVKQWLSLARMSAFTAGTRTHEQHIRRLEELCEAALAAENYGAAIQAEIQIGKACGHYTERHEVSHTTPEGVLDEIAERVGPDVAERLAAQRGIQWTPKQSLN